MSQHTNPDRTTRDEEAREARKPHVAGRGPTEAEATAADETAPSPDVAEHHDEMRERGAGQEGEGRLP